MTIITLYDMKTEVPDVITKYNHTYTIIQSSINYDGYDVYDTLKRIRENWKEYRFTVKRFIHKGIPNPNGGYLIPFWIVYQRKVW